MITANGWTLDAILLHNSGVHLYHRGGQNGQFIEVRDSKPQTEITARGSFTGNTTVTVGTYEDAFESITDAYFHASSTHHFATHEAAIEFAESLLKTTNP